MVELNHFLYPSLCCLLPSLSLLPLIPCPCSANPSLCCLVDGHQNLREQNLNSQNLNWISTGQTPRCLVWLPRLISLAACLFAWDSWLPPTFMDTRIRLQQWNQGVSVALILYSTLFTHICSSITIHLICAVSHFLSPVTTPVGTTPLVLLGPGWNPPLVATVRARGVELALPPLS